MKKKIVISGPILSRSGYGEMARFALRALRKQEDLFDIYILPTNWGNTGWIVDGSEETKLIHSLIGKTQLLLQQSKNQPNFDIALQVTIPNEWKKMAVKNIGYTAGIETNMVSPAWLQPSLAMDKIIVISEHSKSSFVNATFMDQNGNAGRGIVYKITTPIEVCHFPVRKYEEKNLDLELKHDFNFLAVCQWSARKNLEQTIINFFEEFKNDNVGLVLKINTSNDSLIDMEITTNRLKNLINNLKKDSVCSLHLLHGHMTEQEVHALYKHPKIKAVVSTTHGEGFGFPLFEAAYSELPVIATDWSGHLDFLSMPQEDGTKKKMFGKVNYELKPLQQEHVWQGVLEAGTQWAYPEARSFKDKLRDLYKDHGRYKSQSKKLKFWIEQEFSEEKVYNKFIGMISENFNVEDLLKNMNVEENIFEHE